MSTIGHLRCPKCEEWHLFRLYWNENRTTFHVDGIAIPFTKELAVELSRRGYAALCPDCWEGKEVVKKPDGPKEPKRIIIP